MLAMGTGIFASNKTSNTLVGLDQKFNFSGNYPDAKVIVNENYNNTDDLKYVQTGGREFDVNEYIKKLEKVDERYEKIRNNNEDVTIISENTGIPGSKIQRIKEHLFIKDYIKDEGIGRFDSDVEIADAWDRLINGNYNPNDIDLLNHEYYESRFEGIFASNKTSNTLVGLDQKFNFSGNYPKSFSAGMSPEDAARYNAYWDSFENGTHTLPEMSAEDFSRFEFGIEHLSRTR